MMNNFLETVPCSNTFSDAVWDKTGKTSVLPGFSKIEQGCDSGVVLQCNRGSYLA